MRARKSERSVTNTSSSGSQSQSVVGCGTAPIQAMTIIADGTIETASAQQLRTTGHSRTPGVPITFTSHRFTRSGWPLRRRNTHHQSLDGRSEPCSLCMAQLLARQPDGSYQAKSNVRIPMRGYRDFEKSFDLPAGQEVTAKKKLAFHDDLSPARRRHSVGRC